MRLSQHSLVRTRPRWTALIPPPGPSPQPPAPSLAAPPPPPPSSDLDSAYMHQETVTSPHKNTCRLTSSFGEPDAYFQCGVQVLKLANVPLPTRIAGLHDKFKAVLSGITPWNALWLAIEDQLFIHSFDLQSATFASCDFEDNQLGWKEGVWHGKFPSTIFAMDWGRLKDGRCFTAIAFPFQIRLYQWEGKRLVDLYINTLTNRQNIQRVFITQQLRVLYVGDSGWVREADSVKPLASTPTSLRSKLTHLVRQLDPFTYSVKDICEQDGRVLLIVKRNTQLFSRQYRRILIFNRALQLEQTITAEKLRAASALKREHYRTISLQYFQPKAIVFGKQDEIIAITKQGLRLKITKSGQRGLNLNISYPPPLGGRTDKVVVPTLANYIPQQFVRLRAVRMVGSQCFAVRMRDGVGAFLTWWDNNFFQVLEQPFEEVRLLPMHPDPEQPLSSQRRLWAVLTPSALHLYSRQRLQDLIHGVLRFGAQPSAREQLQKDLDQISSIYGQVRCSQSLVQILAAPQFYSIQTPALVDRLQNRYGIVKVVPKTVAVKSPSQQVLRLAQARLQLMGTKQLPRDPPSLKHPFHQYSAKVYGYLLYVNQALQPFSSSPLLSDCNFQAVRNRLTKLFALLKKQQPKQQALHPWQPQSQSKLSYFDNPYLRKNDNIEFLLQKAVVAPKGSFAVQRKFLTFNLSRWVERLILIVDFVEDLKRQDVVFPEPIWLDKIWSERQTCLKLRQYVLTQSRTKPALKRLVHGVAESGQLPQLFTSSVLRLQAARAEFQNLQRQLQDYSFKDGSLVGRLAGVFSPRKAHFDQYSWEQRFKNLTELLFSEVANFDPDCKQFYFAMRRLGKGRKAFDLLSERRKYLEIQVSQVWRGKDEFQEGEAGREKLGAGRLSQQKEQLQFISRQFQSSLRQ